MSTDSGKNDAMAKDVWSTQQIVDNLLRDTSRQWAESVDLPVAWLNVDALDAEPTVFWSHLIAAVRSVCAEVDDEPELLLRERGPIDRLFLVALIAELELAPTLTLVLDGLDLRSLDPARNPTYAASHYRNRWYDNSGYQPVFWGTSDTYWTTNDYRWYDEGSDYDNDDDGGGFGDS